MRFLRKRIRLEHFDYSTAGAYFVTVCSKEKRPIFWENVAAATCRQHVISLSHVGLIVDSAINQIPKFYPHITVDKYCIMPDHIHLILVFGANDRGEQTHGPTLSTVVGQMKRWSSMEAGLPLWQKSFIDRVIRNEKGYLTVWEYIDNNPRKLDSGYEGIDITQV